ncbi:MAG: hypothetical protein ACE5IR_09925 [bacterium]
MLKSIKSQPKHFLKPLFLIYERPVYDLVNLVDDSIVWPVSPVTLSERIEKLFTISDKLNELAEIPASIGDISLRKILVLRYLYTRDSMALRPQRNFLSSVGYTFPLAQILFKVDSGKEVEPIEELNDSQLLTSKLVDKVNVCPFCEHTQINFRELCPNCRSLNISEETTIHHFRCSYVGRESEFREGFTLRCPKCSKELRHIGVDYDKPSEVLWCHDCNHNFSEPLLSCFCLVCAKTFAPEDAFLKHINEYTLSQEGFRAAEEGVLPGFGLINILKKELGFYKHEVFREYLRIEIARCRRYKYSSTLAKFNLKSASQALDNVSLRYSRKLRNDFAALITKTFRTTDLLTDLRNGEILIIFTHTDCDKAKIAFTRLNESIAQLLDKKVDSEYALFDLAKEDKLEEIWARVK